MIVDPFPARAERLDRVWIPTIHVHGRWTLVLTDAGRLVMFAFISELETSKKDFCLYC